MKNRKKKKYFIKIVSLLLIIFIGYRAVSQILYKNEGISRSVGKVNKGELINAYKLPYKGENFSYYSPFSYYILGRSYVHSKVYQSITDAYQLCEKGCPGIKFRYMECSKRKGGKMFPHITHQNGLSADFMTPLKKNEKQYKGFDRIGIWRYLMNFDAHGKAKINKKVSIDFNLMAKHIINLEKSARKNGLRIKKVIFKINLKDDLFRTKYGQKLKRMNIYFARNLPERINKLHDDHYHIDFEILKRNYKLIGH